MKLQFKHQKFQADAAKAVVDVFAGQPYLTPSYMVDMGKYGSQVSVDDDQNFGGWGNQKIIPELSDEVILEHIQKIQRDNQIAPSQKLEGRYNLTIEMETGVGKTYTYIKTMYELNKHYGWSKFIVVVPSVAIREGVYKSFQTTQEHFSEEYGKKIRFFIYNSKQLTDIDRFASDSSINVMIINSQAFNATGKDARRIYMQLDEFGSRKPIDIIAKTNPILIIDEPQSVEGEKTKQRLKEFCPLFTLRYSATHKKDSIYNMVYRLDAMDAYNKRLVKKIAVKGITESGSTATEGYVYLEGINLSGKDPTATVQFELRGNNGVRTVSRILKVGDNLYNKSNQLEEYKNNFIITSIDGRKDAVDGIYNTVTFLNGIKLHPGDVIGKVDEMQLRRIQIRETILSHIQIERRLFYKGVKVLSLFFIDHVENYRQYDDSGNTYHNGVFADMFEEEYKSVVENLQLSFGEDEYVKYLNSIEPSATHAGYFSHDKKGKMINSKVSRSESSSDDVSAYELIMKDKERLLDLNPKRSPVRFIFSHSALKEGWDNPNVFQICTLKQSNSEVRKRQEVGRGLRLCVNNEGVRMDAGVLGDDVHNDNVLTIIASESYDSFAKGLQTELAEAVGDRPRAVSNELFIGKVVRDGQGNEQVIDVNAARAIVFELTVNGYIDRNGALTDKYYEDKKNGALVFAEEVKDCAGDIIKIIGSVYDSRLLQPENARGNNVELTLDKDKLAMPEFKALWNKINSKSVYVVDFDSQELINNAIDSLNTSLHVSKVYFKVESGAIESISSREELAAGASFTRGDNSNYSTGAFANPNVKYDLIGKLVEQTGLTRKTIVSILKGIEPAVFNQFKYNPEDFIIKAANLINDQKGTVIVQHITYNRLDERYDTSIFTEPTIKGKLGVNAIETKRHLYDHVVCDSKNELDYVKQLDSNSDVAVYVKLPGGFYISTPLGKYNPDWAIAFNEGTVKHIYFVAETKGSMRDTELRKIEKDKIQCAREHFKAISGDSVAYHVIGSYSELMNIVMR